ncbi:hypothetical protein QBC46DRAFT_399876 [Diplogelasinospora grovesii]|uniref:ATPase AAA-type core domain-containing protein n=1 Tax=Diplogelasinospora grovesii TaxID=303347 RepID=A0AAN6MYV3_9PEZI|nr:hypothetical protein QBC46DRAFT_399876 [Diplogelasinospora grovesii]
MAVQISAGELPSHAGLLEAQLSLIFEIAQRWGAIVLLDEADVYLEQRSSRDLGRNGLVSVFLRKMEFCEAIMFLTTNRVTEFDEAILSRVHLAMKYANLDRDRRKLIWKIFLDRASNSHGKADISDKELDKLVRIEFNGRQVWLPGRYGVNFANETRSKMSWPRRVLWPARRAGCVTYIMRRRSRQAKSLLMISMVPITNLCTERRRAMHGPCLTCRKNVVRGIPAAAR